MLCRPGVRLCETTSADKRRLRTQGKIGGKEAVLSCSEWQGRWLLGMLKQQLHGGQQE